MCHHTALKTHCISLLKKGLHYVYISAHPQHFGHMLWLAMLSPWLAYTAPRDVPVTIQRLSNKPSHPMCVHWGSLYQQRSWIAGSLSAHVAPVPLIVYWPACYNPSILSLSLTLTHSHTHARTHSHTHARTHARTHHFYFDKWNVNTEVNFQFAKLPACFTSLCWTNTYAKIRDIHQGLDKDPLHESHKYIQMIQWCGAQDSRWWLDVENVFWTKTDVPWPNSERDFYMCTVCTTIT